MASMGSFFDLPIPVNRRVSGPGVATPMEITDRYTTDPIVGIRLGHPFADRGFEFLMRDILQAALAPKDDEDWVRMLRAPPPPDRLVEILAPYREAFRLDHPSTPVFQVRPSAERLAEAAGRKTGKGKKRRVDPDEENESEDEEAGAQPIASLLPDLPTGEAIKQGTDFFVRRGAVKTIGAGAVLPALYAHMVLFPPGGGGYLGLPHGADSIKYQIVGRTLWETVWLNVLRRDIDGLADPDAPWPAPVTAAVFPWLDPSLSDMPLGRNEAGAVRPMERARLHPAHIPMPRRYLLSPAVPGRCDLTDMEGPVFTAYSRWPKGLQYQPRGWWFPATAQLEPPASKPDDPPRFVRARGPMRFDDWLDTALFDEKGTGGRGGRRLLPPVLRNFNSVHRTHVGALRELQERDQGVTALHRHLPFRVRAFAPFFFNKPVGGTSQRELPIWLLPSRDHEWLRTSISQTIEVLADMANILATSARTAARLGRRQGPAAVADDMSDGLLADLEAAVLALPGRMAEIAERSAHNEDVRNEAATTARAKLLRTARTLAITRFEDGFPIEGRDSKIDVLLAREHGRLKKRLNTLVKPYLPRENP